MNISNSVLDQLMEKYGLSSDYGVAKLMGVGRGSVSNWRNGRSQMADEVAIRAAALLGIDHKPLLAELQAERATDEASREAWRQIAFELHRAGIAITIIFAGILGFWHAPVARATTEVAQTFNIMTNNASSSS